MPDPSAYFALVRPDGVSLASTTADAVKVTLNDSAGTPIGALSTVPWFTTLVSPAGTSIFEAASADVNANSTASVTAAVAGATGLRLVGFAARESDTTAAVASFQIVHGADTSGSVIIPVELAANESTGDWFWPGISCTGGISLNYEAGKWDCTLFHMTLS